MLKAVVGHSRENFVKFGSLTTKFTVIVSPNTPNDLLFACCHQNSAEKKKSLEIICVALNCQSKLVLVNMQHSAEQGNTCLQSGIKI